ncbi:MAG: hypothetical protein QME35_04945 [Thermoanaerobacteraceae bacterium]|nr:hypothetical protein [Thermoanaerobacteraceae bacterium]
MTLLSISTLSPVFATSKENNNNVSIKKIEKTLEKIDNDLYQKNHVNIKRSPEILKAIQEGKLDLSKAPDSIANINGVRVDYEYNPILMYPSDPYSWGRHLLGDKYYDNGNLFLVTYGYATTYTTGEDVAVPYYWSDVRYGDPVRIRNLENTAYVVTGYRSDFGPNQRVCGDHIVDLGYGINSRLHGNGHLYCRTCIWIRGGEHY